MSIIPASGLSRSDLSRLSNNIGHRKQLVTRNADAPYRRVLAAVNRSLASVGERVSSRVMPLSPRLVGSGKNNPRPVAILSSDPVVNR